MSPLSLWENLSLIDKIDWLNNCDRAYGILCLGMYPNIYHLIYFAEFPFELWKILDKAFDEAWSEPSISSFSLSQYFLASTFSDEFIYDVEVSHTVHIVATLFDSNVSSFNQEENIEEPSFFVSLEGDSSSCDTNDEK